MKLKLCQINWRERCELDPMGSGQGQSVSRSMGERRGVYRLLVGKPEDKRPLGRPRRRWEDNIKMDLQEVGCGGMDWI